MGNISVSHTIKDHGETNLIRRRTMSDTYLEGEEIHDRDFKRSGLSATEYENCRFENCNFSGLDLTGVKFIDCEFDNCDLTNAKIVDTAFRGVQFQGCKLMGLQFDTCSQLIFDALFRKCQLNLCSFHGCQLKKFNFINCGLKDTDFSEADLTEAIFTYCDLKNTTFERTNLEKADLSTAYDFQIDPEQNRIKKAKFSQAGLAGLLVKYDIQVT